MPYKRSTIALAIAALSAFPLAHAQQSPAQFQPPTREIDTVVIWGRGLDMIGEAKAASEGTVGYADFETRPVSRAGELVEVIPGVIATQHSGEGKANQYFLRGFNLDHGTDFSASVDGVPVNMRTHGHGQGYLDLNFIIPEIVERVDFRKGPYSAFSGDFSAAGSSRFVTHDRLDSNFAEVTVGENGYARGVGAVSMPFGGLNLLIAGEGQVYDGPWALDQDLEKINLLAKLSHENETSKFGIALYAYDSSWTSTDQIPQRAVDSGLIDRLGFIDPDLGGETARYALSANADWTHSDGSRTSVHAYGVDYDFRLVSNFTYFLEDPVFGDEFVQRDDRQVFGAAVEHVRSFDLGDRRGEVRFGADTRFDDIDDIGLFRSVGGIEKSAVRQDSVEELSVSGYGEVELPLTNTLRATLGLRGDYYDASVNALTLAANSGSADDTLFSPSLALAWRVVEELELYGNYGRGFHSNDVRGATIAIDPATGNPAEKVDILVAAEGAELGARWERDRLNATLSVFWLELDGELVFVGDGGTTEPNDATRRYGVELAAFWEATDWLVLDASAAYTDAGFQGVETTLEKIPGAVESVLAVGAVGRWGPFSSSLRVRHFSEAPLIEDDSVRSDGTTLVNFGGRYEFGQYEIKVDILNLLDSDDRDITYFYESQLRGEPTGVEDIHFHPVEPRQVRFSFRTRF